MQTIVLIIHVLVCFCVVVLVLLQHGKGADIGAAFGSGASNTMFGSVGATPFLMKITVSVVAIFFMTSIGLNALQSRAEHEEIPTVPAHSVESPGNSSSM